MYSLNNIKVIVKDNYNDMSIFCAQLLADEIRINPNLVVGLATGSTPLGMYNELVRMYENKTVTFSQVKTFNLDEYYPISSENEQSYHFFMHDNFFKYVNVATHNIHIPDGSSKDPSKECSEYDNKIINSGGIDLQILGIGVNGHIGFNEPSDTFTSGTSLNDLNESTIKANSRFFRSEDNVPRKAISMGIKTIMMAKKIVLIANSSSKSEAIKKALLGPISPKIPASVLQLHRDVTFILDKEAASAFISAYSR